MTKQRAVLMLILCSSVIVLAVQAFSRPYSPAQAPAPSDMIQKRNMTEEERAKERERWRNMTQAERIAGRKKEFEKWRRKRELERPKRQREAKKKREQWRAQSELETKKMEEKYAKLEKEADGFLFAMCGLKATEEQWKLILPKLKKIKRLRNQLRSGVGLSMVSGSSDTNQPTWQWKSTWKNKSPDKLTQAQKLVRELIELVEKRNTRPETFKRKMAALRKARSKQSEIERQLAEARRELREILTTTRQEAVLTVMRWL